MPIEKDFHEKQMSKLKHHLITAASATSRIILNCKFHYAPEQVKAPIITDGKRICYNYEFFDTPNKEQAGTLLLSILQLALQHPQRKSTRHPVIYNFCSNVVANFIISSCYSTNILTLCSRTHTHKDAPFDKAYEERQNWTVEELYTWVWKNVEFKLSDGSSLGNGQMMSLNLPDLTKFYLNLDYSQSQNPAQNQRSIEEWDVTWNRVAGDLAGNSAFDKLFVDRPKNEIPFRQLLQKYMGFFTGDVWDQTATPHRRFLAGLAPYSPGKKLREQAEPIVVLLDSSGSYFNTKDMNEGVAQIESMRRQLNCDVIVICTDTKVQSISTVKPQQPLKDHLKILGGGGTCFQAAGEYINNLKKKPRVVVAFTDGYTNHWGDINANTIWCINSPVKAPYGVTIQMKD